MGQRIRDQKNQPGFAFAKNTQALLIFLCFLLSACQSSKKSDNQVQAPPGFREPVLKQYTFKGDSRYPRYNRYGNGIVYISSNRGYEHKNSQVYIYNLNTQKEKRLTFQNGLLSYPVFNNFNSEVYYLSSTDKDKENPIILNHLPTKILNYENISEHFAISDNEIYSSTLNGRKIKRFSRNDDYELHLNTRPNYDHLIFSQQRNERLQLKLINSKSNVLWAKYKKNKHLHSPSFINKDSLVFVESSLDFKNSSIMLVKIGAREAQKIYQLNAHVHSVYKHPRSNEFVFSANYPDSENYELFLYRQDANCLMRLTFSSAQELDPSFSPAGDKILFSTNRNSRFEVFEMPIDKSSSCQSMAKTVNL